MPFVPHTPESLLSRSDSKNPAATCHGLTAAGRLCRRAIAVAESANATPSVDSEGGHGQQAYCWQHKVQAMQSPASVSPHSFRSAVAGVRERTSVETLIERLGLLDVGDTQDLRKSAAKPKVERSTNVDLTPSPKSPSGSSNHRKNTAGPRRQQQSNLALFWCLGAPDEDRLAARPVAIQHSNASRNRAQKPVRQVREKKSAVAQPKTHTSPRPIPKYHQDGNKRVSDVSTSQIIPERPSLIAPTASQTAQLLSLIPHNASPQTSALLLAELAKPPSVYDEPGYIYIFWLTPENLSSTPAAETVSSLLSPGPSSSASHLRPPLNGRRTSSVLESFSIQSTSMSSSRTREGRPMNTPKTILLKIGRASNIQRRLNEWTRQCGYNLSLVRYYPYRPTSPLPSPSSRSLPSPSSPLKVPNAHRIERLIHLELAHKRAAPQSGSGHHNLNQKCVRCGAAHREWFEVEASRDGIKGIDEIVRRWVDWGLTNDK